jgi:hypothetical protein
MSNQTRGSASICTEVEPKLNAVFGFLLKMQINLTKIWRLIFVEALLATIAAIVNPWRNHRIDNAVCLI